MTTIKQFSTVEMTDGSIGSVMDVYIHPYESYDIDLSDPDPSVPLPPDWMRTVKRDQIANILWEPLD